MVDPKTQSTFLSFQEAVDKVLSMATTVAQTEEVALLAAAGRVLATPIVSPINIPPFNNSAMDGYAIRLADVTAENTVLPLAGKSLAGHPFQGVMPQGHCVRIMTGAQVPEGADAVIMQEQTNTVADGIEFTQLAKPQQNIRFKGEEIAENAEVFSAGMQLGTTSLPTIATLGYATVTVYRKVKVAIFSTGDELQQVGKPLQAGQIYDSNSLTIRLMLEKMGCEVIDLGVIADVPDAISAAFNKADELADVVISSGGVSVGDADYTKQVLDELGHIGFWKIAMKPGKPFAFGELKHALFCGLPGNPVSAAVTFYQVVQPLLRKMAGFTQWQPMPSFDVKTTTKLKKSAGRLDFQRGILSKNEQGELVVRSTGPQSSGMFTSFSQGNCFIVLEKERGKVAPGEVVTVTPFDKTLLD